MNLGLVFGCALLALLAAVLLAWPALRRPPSRQRSSFDLAVYRDQLAEIDRDRQRGLIAPAEAAAARLEVERRILRLADASPASATEAAPGGRWLALGVAIILPILAGGLYLRLGEPELRDQPFAAREAPAAPLDIAAMVAKLEARLAREPNDLQGWLMLGRSKTAMSQPDSAVLAYRKALELAPDDPEALGGLAESLIISTGGIIGPEPLSLLTRLDGLTPGEPRVTYYLGLAAAQQGDTAAATERWRRLLADAPADAAWRPRIVDAIRSAASQLGMDVEPMLAANAGAPSAPAASDAAAIAALPPAEQQQRIRGMVEGLQARLDADGGDAAGWARLARARGVLGEPDAAIAAWDKALDLAPEDALLLKGKAGALLGPESAVDGMPQVTDAAAALYEKALALHAHDPEALWFLGLRALQQGQPGVARERWDRLIDRLDPARPETAQLRAQIGRLLTPG